MNTQLKDLEKKYNALSLRERAMVAVAVLAVIYFLWYTVLYSYLLTTDEEVFNNLQKIKTQISQIEGQIDSISELVGRNPTANLIAQSQSLKTENEVLNQKIREYIKNMVPPTDIDEMLNNIIQKATGLTVLGIENIEVKPLFDSKDIDLYGKRAVFQIFKHGVIVQLQGNYFDVVRFLKALEKQKLNVIWSSFSYEVIKYPKAKIALELNTLSLEDEWIGV